jgi:hypothetical protein
MSETPPPRRGFTDHALVQLTLMRMREFIREPEALFWSMIFPIALAAGLGIAFRNRPPEILKVAAVTPRLAEALRQEKLLDVTQLPPQLAEQFVRTGKVALVAEPAADGNVVYRYDDTNPEGRQARTLADQAIQRASGRKDPVAGSDQIMREPGSRYIDFLIPGLIGMGIMGNSIWGPGFSIVDARRKKLMKRIVATPMPKHYYLLSFLLWRMILGVRRPPARIVPGLGRGVCAGDARLQRGRAAAGFPGTHHRGGVRSDEHDYGSDVDPIRRVLFLPTIPRSGPASD